MVNDKNETWLVPGVHNNITHGELMHPGYKLNHVPHSHGKGSGVAIVYTSHFSLDFQNRPPFTAFGCIIGNDCVRRVSIYCLSSCSSHEKLSGIFLDDFSSYIDSL